MFPQHTYTCVYRDRCNYMTPLPPRAIMIQSALSSLPPQKKYTYTNKEINENKNVRQVYIRGSSSSLDSQLFKRHLYRSCRPPLRYLERAQVPN